MSTYYLRKSGSDANNGTSPSTAWLTLTKALSTTGIASSDILYIGAGTYREIVTVNMTSATVETKIIGDIDGRYTGDSGDIILSAYLINDESLPSTTSALLHLNGKNFLTFQNIKFISGKNDNIDASQTASTNIKFLNCTFLHMEINYFAIDIIVGFGTSANWIIDKCVFLINQNINITLTTGSGSDYNSNILISNCLFFIRGVKIVSSGTSAQEGGGVMITNCTFLGTTGFILTSSTRIGGSTFSFPVLIQNCIIFADDATAALASSELGNTIENYNVIYALTPRSNIEIGPNSVSDNSIAPLLNVIDTQKINSLTNFPFSPLKNSPLIGQGNNTIKTLNDFSNLQRPKGNPQFLFSGYATSSTAVSLVDSTKIFPSGNLIGYTVQIIEGLGNGQVKTINENHTGQFFVDGRWLTNPNTTSKYIIYNGAISSSGPVSSGTSKTLRDDNAKWGLGFWKGYTCLITSGTSSGNSIIISGNDQTKLSGYQTWSTIPTSGSSAYQLSWGSGSSNSGINYLHCCVGYSEVLNTAQIQSGNTISGTTAIQLFGSSCHDFNIPVTGGSNTISVMGYYNNFYSGVKPQLLITNTDNVGINNASGIMVGNSGQWEQISVTIVPSGNGIVTARLLSNSTGAMGISYWDSFSIV